MGIPDQAVPGQDLGLGTNSRESLELFCDVCTEERGVNLDTLEEAIRLAVEIAREGREGRKIGTLFVISDLEETLRHSACLILDPLLGHPPERKRLDDPNVRETLKEGPGKD